MNSGLMSHQYKCYTETSRIQKTGDETFVTLDSLLDSRTFSGYDLKYLNTSNHSRRQSLNQENYQDSDLMTY